MISTISLQRFGPGKGVKSCRIFIAGYEKARRHVATHTNVLRIWIWEYWAGSTPPLCGQKGPGLLQGTSNDFFPIPSLIFDPLLILFIVYFDSQKWLFRAQVEGVSEKAIFHNWKPIHNNLVPIHRLLRAADSLSLIIEKSFLHFLILQTYFSQSILTAYK